MAGFDNFFQINPVRTVVLQPDGKILLGGLFDRINGTPRTNLARVNQDGTLDQSFNASVSGGQGYVYVSTLVLQPDGKIFLAGVFTQVNGVAHSGLARLDADGNLDPTFNPSTDATNDGGVERAVVQPDSKILLSGAFTRVNGVARNGLARLNADGALDESFNANAALSGYDSVNALALQPDGKLVVSEYSRNAVTGARRRRVARLNPDGSVDSGFNARTDQGAPSPVVLQPDGKIIFIAESSGSNGAAVSSVIRLNADGTLDAGFNASTRDIFTSNVFAAAVQGDGKILLGGQFTEVNGVERRRFARLNTDGTLDTGFDAPVYSGYYTAISGEIGYVTDLLVQPDGKIILGGFFTGVTGKRALGIARLVGGSSRPILTSAPSATGVVGQPFSFQISAAENPTGFAAVGLPAGLSLNPATGLLGGTPAVAGTYPIALSATNLAGTDTRAFTLVILAPPPVITSAPAFGAQVGQPFSYQITTALNDASGFAADGLPPGLSIDPATGAISGAPTQAGSYAVTLIASNAGGMGGATLTLTVSPISVPLVSVTVDAPTISRAAGQAATVTFTRSDGDVSQPLKVAYTVSGSAVGGRDYATLSGVKKLKAGRTSATLQIVPLSDGAKGTVLLTLQPGAGYTLGSPATAKSKIAN